MTWKALSQGEGPEPGQHSCWQGDHVSVYDKGAGEQIAELAEIMDVTQALACATKSDKSLHGFMGILRLANILMDGGKLSVVIDFGGAAGVILPVT